MKFWLYFSCLVRLTDTAFLVMGNASKWIRNFLMGKREDKSKKTGPSVPAETCTLGTPIVISSADSPKVRRRWSFKRSNLTKAITHESSRSFDSTLVPKQVLLGYHTHQNNAKPLLLNAHAAATKIQALYRSYLARRALRALRGLVKLQALARGYMVRKQMNTVLRSIHAVMAIQVRARIHRIQMAEEPPVIVGRRKSYRESSASDRQLRKEISENIADGTSFLTTGGLRSRSGRIDRTLDEKVEYDPRIPSFGRLSVSQREYQLKMCPSPSALSFRESSSSAYDGQLEEFSLKMAQRNSRGYSACQGNKHPFAQSPAKCPDYTTPDSRFRPNYMTNTKSSKAKDRSHSEPRQRPKLGTKRKSRRSSSMDGKNDKENQYPWLIKLYRGGKSTTYGECDSNYSEMTSNSNQRKSLIPFEPPMNLY